MFSTESLSIKVLRKLASIWILDIQKKLNSTQEPRDSSTRRVLVVRGSENNIKISMED